MLEYASHTDVGRVRASNEDYCKVLPDIGLYLLADGMGGAKAGERASRIAVETVAEMVEKSPHRDASVLLKAVEEANRRVREEAGRDSRLEGMGTTIVAALSLKEERNGNHEEDLAIASVGDSRAYVFEDGKLRGITEDQTWVRDVGIPLGLDAESLKTHPMRHVLTMAIGVNSALTIRYYRVKLSADAILLLSSDGLHGIVDQKRIEEILERTSSLDAKCKELIHAARDAGGPDNISAILVRAA
jgi:serine/threonine protein phosphatase PrpC